LKTGKENIGPCRDDGLAIMNNKSGKNYDKIDKTGKELHNCFENFGLMIYSITRIHWVKGI
jgi:hypothetical protein